MNKDSNTKSEFSRIRSMLLPIHNWELKKFLPMSIIMMMILFNYTLMRDTKDALVNSHPVSDTEVISFLKLFLVTPAAMIFVIIFTKLVNVFSSQKIFYVVVSTFLIFFALFGFVIYPNMELLHPEIAHVQALQAEYPRLKFFLSIWGMWGYSSFYVMSELWGSSMLSLLFWKFANEIVRTNEAKRFYPMFALLANVALMISGKTVKYFSQINADMDPVLRWGITLKYLTIFMLIAGVIAMLVYRWINNNIVTDPKFCDQEKKDDSKKKSKPKLGVIDSFKYVLSSPYIGYIALLVLSYGVSINIIEVVWKKSLKLFTSGDANQYNAIMGDYSFYTGLTTIILIMFVKGLVTRFGWLTSAAITPIVLGITGVCFLSVVLAGSNADPLFVAFGTSALGGAVLLGALQGILSKGIKYALFDPTKEMAYIPLDSELKAKGKAAVDVIGGRLGKAGGSLLLIGLYNITGISNVIELSHIILVCVVIMIAVWLLSAVNLGKLYNAKVEQQEANK